MGIGNFAKILIILFVMVAALFGTLVVLDVMSTETFTDNLVKIGGVTLIALATAAVVLTINKK